MGEGPTIQERGYPSERGEREAVLTVADRSVGGSDSASTSFSDESPSGDESRRGFGTATQRKGVLAIFDQGVVSLASFLTTLMIGRQLGQEVLGHYYQGVPVIIIATTLVISLIGVPYAVKIQNRAGEARRRWVSVAVLVQIALLSLVVLGLGVVAGVSGAVGASDFAWFIFAVGVALAGVWQREFIRRVAQADFRMVPALVLDSVACVVQVTGVYVLVHRAEFWLPSVFFWMGLSHAVAAVLGWVWLRPDWSRPQFGCLEFWSDLREGWRFGRVTAGGTMLSTLQGWTMPWLLGLLASIETSGRYAECLLLALLLNPVVMGLSSFLAPIYANQMVKQTPQQLRASVLRLATPLALACGCGLVLLGVMANTFIALLFRHDSDVSMWWTMMLLSSMGIAKLATLPFESGLLALGRPDYQLRANTYSLGLTLIVAGATVAYWGELGAALGTFLGGVIVIVIRIHAFRQLTKEATVAS